MLGEDFCLVILDFLNQFSMQSYFPTSLFLLHKYSISRFCINWRYHKSFSPKLTENPTLTNV